MHLSQDEKVIKVHHHHPFPFIIHVGKVLAASFPFYFVASLFSPVFTTPEIVVVYLGITFFFSMIVLHNGLVYYLDRLVMTNLRIVHIDWKSLFAREETEADFQDIQDIQTEENGILAKFRFFDYGTLRIQTASTKVSIYFENANDPEGIKHFIYHILIKPARIKPTFSRFTQHDSATTITEPYRTEEKTTPFAGSTK